MVHVRSDSWAPSLHLSLRISDHKGQNQTTNSKLRRTSVFSAGFILVEHNSPIHRIVEDIEMHPRNSVSTSPPIVSLAFLRIGSFGIDDETEVRVAERLSHGDVDLPKPFLATFCTLGYASLFWSWFA